MLCECTLPVARDAFLPLAAQRGCLKHLVKYCPTDKLKLTVRWCSDLQNDRARKRLSPRILNFEFVPYLGGKIVSTVLDRQICPRVCRAGDRKRDLTAGGIAPVDMRFPAPTPQRKSVLKNRADGPPIED